MENEKVVEPTVKQQPKKNVLGILSTVFAGVALIGSWIPILNIISMIFAIAAIIMGTISFVFVLMKKSKYIALPIIGIVVSIISIVFSSSINTAFSDSLSSKDTSQKVSSSSSTSSDTSKKSSDTSSSESTTSSSKSSTDTDENKEYKVGDTVSVSDTEITVTDVKRNYSAKYGTPSDGQEFVKVTLKFKNTSNKTISTVGSGFKLQDGNGVVETSSFKGSSGLDDRFDYSEVASNGTKTGSLVFEVPKGDNNLTFIYEPNVFTEKQVKIKL